MFPFAHLYIAEKYFDELTNEIAWGAIIPDFLTLLPNFSINDTHKLLDKKGDFERAWNLHVLGDEYSEHKYFYRMIPKALERKFGKYVGHIFLEVALDNNMFADGIYFAPPKSSNNIVKILQNRFKNELPIIKSIMRFLVTWDKNTYSEHLANSLMYICGVHHHFLTRSQVEGLIEQCKPLLPDYRELLEDCLDNL